MSPSERLTELEESIEILEAEVADFFIDFEDIADAIAELPL